MPNSKLFHVKEQNTNDADKAVRHCLKRGFAQKYTFLEQKVAVTISSFQVWKFYFKYSPKGTPHFVDSQLERMEFILDNLGRESCRHWYNALTSSAFRWSSRCRHTGLRIIRLKNNELASRKNFLQEFQILVVANPVSVTLTKRSAFTNCSAHCKLLIALWSQIKVRKTVKVRILYSVEKSTVVVTNSGIKFVLQ